MLSTYAAKDKEKCQTLLMYTQKRHYNVYKLIEVGQISSEQEKCHSLNSNKIIESLTLVDTLRRFRQL